MNSNHRVPRLVLGSTLILLLLSIIDATLGFNSETFSRINLVSDITSDKKGLTPTPDTANKEVSITGINFNLYRQPKLITSFHADTTLAALPNFDSKLYDHINGRKNKIRIAYFGDSMIEGDLLTQTLRKLLQEKFGGQGVGFVPITSAVSKFRNTVSVNYSDNWIDENFKTSNSRQLYFSGHLFRSSGAWVSMTDRTVAEPAMLEKSLLCGQLNSATNIGVNSSIKKITAPARFNRIALANNSSSSIRLEVRDERLPVYGISFESAEGIFVDNFSFRGITGIELNAMDTSFLKSISENNPYDLIILQYGVNMLFRPKESEFSWYKKNMIPVVKKIKKAFPKSDIILVSTADRAFRYGNEYKSAIGIDSLIHSQAAIALENNICFYNQFESMGGENSIVDWASQKPALANKDYIHPNHRGAEVLAGYFYEALLKDFYKYRKKKK